MHIEISNLHYTNYYYSYYCFFYTQVQHRLRVKVVLSRQSHSGILPLARHGLQLKKRRLSFYNQTLGFFYFFYQCDD